jgi:hypothetical protein
MLMFTAVTPCGLQMDDNISRSGPPLSVSNESATYKTIRSHNPNEENRLMRSVGSYKSHTA